MARSGYSAAAQPIRTPRSIEYEAFARITARLRAGVTAGRGGFAALAEALHDNRRLWTLLASDVAEPDNGLSAELRARIFYLAEFTSQHTSKILAGKASAEPLIEINAAIMGGLRSERAAA
ncbi:flagellar biosynthesis regulator FlaF [Frigidibacter sp. SLM-1]|nr:flagellar biosynthesis regulator FlaF [Frigidibacter sp. ROC022]MCR8724382.1 flagellar biosynthesis regulator FlaF [Frigidibacter sp. ROC022]